MDTRYNLHNLEALFREYLISENISRVSIKNYASDIRHYLAWVQYVLQDEMVQAQSTLDCFIEHSSEELARGYLAYLDSKQTPLRTINRRLSSLRKFYRFCLAREIVNTNPLVSIANKVRVPLNRILKDDGKIVCQDSLLDDFKTFMRRNATQEQQDSLIRTFEDIFGTK